jgi:hypothetical protein
MGVAYASNERKTRALAVGALLLAGLSLGGCATSTVGSTAGSSLMDARAEAPAAPKPGAYPPLGNPPSDRDKPAMTPDERSKLKQELIAARDRQAAVAKAQGGLAPLEPAKP